LFAGWRPVFTSLVPLCVVRFVILPFKVVGCFSGNLLRQPSLVGGVWGVTVTCPKGRLHLSPEVLLVLLLAPVRVFFYDRDEWGPVGGSLGPVFCDPVSLSYRYSPVGRAVSFCEECPISLWSSSFLLPTPRSRGRPFFPCMTFLKGLFNRGGNGSTCQSFSYPVFSSEVLLSCFSWPGVGHARHFLFSDGPIRRFGG